MVPTDFDEVCTANLLLITGRFTISNPFSIDTNYYSTRAVDYLSRFRNFHFKSSGHYDLLFVELTSYQTFQTLQLVAVIPLNRFYISPRSPPQTL